MMPNGVGTGKPPAKSLAPRSVWQSLQLPIAASSRPRLTCAGSNDRGAGGSIAAIAGRHASATAAAAPATTIAAMTPAMIRQDAIGLPSSLWAACDRLVVARTPLSGASLNGYRTGCAPLLSSSAAAQ